MNFYDLTKEQVSKMRVDYDFCACLEYNPQPFNLLDVDHVLAVHEGERDERDWHWVVLLRDGRYVYLQGGCDYTGWGCQSSAGCEFYKTAIEAAHGEIKERYQKNTPEIQAELIKQVEGEKYRTWREKKDSEFEY